MRNMFKLKDESKKVKPIIEALEGTFEQAVLPVLRKIEQLYSINIGGNGFDIPPARQKQMLDDYAVYLNDYDFIMKYYADSFGEQLEKAYKEYKDDKYNDLDAGRKAFEDVCEFINIKDSYYLKTRDGGEVYIDFTFQSQHGDWDDIGANDPTAQARSLIDWLRDGSNRWNTDLLDKFVNKKLESYQVNEMTSQVHTGEAEEALRDGKVLHTWTVTPGLPADMLYTKSLFIEHKGNFYYLNVLNPKNTLDGPGQFKVDIEFEKSYANSRLWKQISHLFEAVLKS